MGRWAAEVTDEYMQIVRDGQGGAGPSSLAEWARLLQQVIATYSRCFLLLLRSLCFFLPYFLFVLFSLFCFGFPVGFLCYVLVFFEDNIIQ